MNIDYTNLLQETLEILKEHGKTEKDVRWCGFLKSRYCPEESWFSWDDFVAKADVFYEDSFGVQYIDHRLVVVGDDWWLERHEYDGSEWWEFKTLPEKPSEYKKPESLMEEE